MLDRLELGELEDGEVVRGEARLRVAVDRYAPEAAQVEPPVEEDDQLSLFDAERVATVAEVPALAPLEPVAAPPVEPVRRLSYTALALFEQLPVPLLRRAASSACARSTSTGASPARPGWRAPRSAAPSTGCSSGIDLAAPVPPSLEEVRRAGTRRRPRRSSERIGGLVEAYCALAARRAAGGARGRGGPSGRSRSSTTACSSTGSSTCSTCDGGRALVADFKSNVLGDHSPAEVVEAEYRLQRLVYAIACFRAGADEVEVVYQFLERPDELVEAVFRREQLPELEAELSAAIARIQAGRFPPRPSECACAGCPALDVVCAGPALRGSYAGPPARRSPPDHDPERADAVDDRRRDRPARLEGRGDERGRVLARLVHGDPRCSAR